MDDTTTDEVAEDATSVLDSGDSTETAEDTQDEPMDDTAADETTEDATSDLDSGDSTETAEDTQDEPMDDTSNKNSADTVETADNINDTTDINEVNNLSDKVSYLDRMRGDAENALAYDPERKGDWDVVRGRLSDEYRKTSDNLKTLAEGKQAEYEQLRNEYFDALEGADSPEKAARLAELTKRGGELSKEIDTANSRSRYADNFANELSRDLDPSKRTTYEGVGGKSFTDLHQSMIQKQGNAVKDFKGTCGDCSAANTMTALGDTKSEAEVVQRARDLNACVDKKIPSFLPESLKEKMRGSNGGTSVAGRSQILDSFGYDCDNRTNQSLAEISQQIENGKGAIINVDHRVLNKQRDVTAMNPVGTDHALTITGIEKDAAGNALANNPGAGGVAAAGAGMGMGIGAAGAFGSIAQQVFAPAQNGFAPQQPTNPTQNAPSGRFTQKNSASVTPAVNAEDPMETLGKLKKLLDAGLIEQAEYDAKKTEILSRM